MVNAEQAKLAGQILSMGDPSQPLPRPVLKNPTQYDVELWLRTYVVEAKQAIDGHMELYAKGSVEGFTGTGGNPGRWDKESSYGALQRIEDDLTRYTLDLISPIPFLSIPLHMRLCVRVMRDYLMLSTEMPLVREGSTTNHDAAQYVRLLTKTISTVATLLSPIGGDPLKVFAEWQKNRFR